MTRALSFKYFLLPYGLFLLSALGTFLVMGHGEFLLWLNSHRNGVLDIASQGITYLGDWPGVALVAVWLMVKNRRAVVVLLVAVVVQVVTTSFLKRVIFDDTLRPKAFFHGVYDLQFIEGVRNYGKFSFPSGHTTIAFVLAAFLAMVVANKRWSPAFLLGGILTGLSRIYLLQHFLIDVIGGAILGVMIAAITMACFGKYMEPRPDRDLKKATPAS